MFGKIYVLIQFLFHSHFFHFDFTFQIGIYYDEAFLKLMKENSQINPVSLKLFQQSLPILHLFCIAGYIV